MESDKSEELSNSELESIGEMVVGELDSGSYGDKFVFSRRQVIALAGAGLSVGALTTLGVDEATAQEAVGQVGTSDAPVDVEAANVNAGSVSTADTATDPSANGEMRRNGSDVKVYSGDGVRNLTNIGSGGGGDVSVSDDGTQVVSAASDLNFAGISVGDDGDGTVTIGDTIDMGSL